jgi:hypothetical protein
MYYTFVTNTTPRFLITSLASMKSGKSLRINEIISPSFIKTTIINETFGNSVFWNKMKAG